MRTSCRHLAPPHMPAGVPGDGGDAAAERAIGMQASLALETYLTVAELVRLASR